MEPNLNQERQQAHALLDMLPAEKLNAVRSLLEVMVDPVSRALANAPNDDEPVTEEEERAVAEAREWLKHNPGIPFEQVVAELGFTMEEVKNYQDPS
jgi:ethanolamine utilization microcompartment shell protein EutL